MPTYPGFNPHKITCDGNSTPYNLCGEIALGKQFKGVDLNTKFDTELHKTQTYC